MTYYDDCKMDLCLNVDFNDGGQNEMISFEQNANAECVYSGAFENEVTVAASSYDCPMDENSMLQANLLSLKTM